MITLAQFTNNLIHARRIMAHPKPSELIPVNTVCLWQRDKSKPPIKVIIKKHVDLYGSFLHYEGRRLDKPENEVYSFYHDDLKPIEQTEKQQTQLPE